MGTQIDNMESVAVHREASDALVLMLVSDDNFSPLQRLCCCNSRQRVNSFSPGVQPAAACFLAISPLSLRIFGASCSSLASIRKVSSPPR
jgi:hypothetical protein